MAIRAIVIGTGYAGEGHTTALEKVEIDVVALCGRTPEAAKRMAEKVSVHNVRYNWQEAVHEFKPDVVVIAAPAVLRRENEVDFIRRRAYDEEKTGTNACSRFSYWLRTCIRTFSANASLIARPLNC